MFSRLSALSVLAVALLAVATPNPAPTPAPAPAAGLDNVKRWGIPTSTVTVTAPNPTPTTASQCNTGPVQCCLTTTDSTAQNAVTVLQSLGLAITGVSLPVGLTCTSLEVIGGIIGMCNANTVCCEDNSHNNFISIGCVPVTL